LEIKDEELENLKRILTETPVMTSVSDQTLQVDTAPNFGQVSDGSNGHTLASKNKEIDILIKVLGDKEKELENLSINLNDNQDQLQKLAEHIQDQKELLSTSSNELK
jgi:hypothetical protein